MKQQKTQQTDINKIMKQLNANCNMLSMKIRKANKDTTFKW